MFYLYKSREKDIPSNINLNQIISYLNPYSTPDKRGFIKKEKIAACQSLVFNTPQSKFEQTPFVDESAQQLVVSWARLDNREDLAAAMRIPTRELVKMGENELLLRAFQKWGDACVEHLVGDFSFCIYDFKNNKILCARDPLGVRPLYYFLSDTVFICSTSLYALLKTDAIPPRISQQWIAEFLLHLSMSFDGTPYHAIKKIPPAHLLIINNNSRQLSKYLDLNDTPPIHHKHSQSYVEEYRELLEKGVSCRLVSDYPIGSELSGGIDSSTVTCLAAKNMYNTLHRLHTFGFAHLQQEPEYIFSVSQAYQLVYNHIITGVHKDENAQERALTILGYPVEHTNSTGHDIFYQMAEAFNIRTLLSGFGGDEFVTTIHGNLVARDLAVKGNPAAVFQMMRGNPFFQSLRFMKFYYEKIKTQNFSTQKYRQNFLDSWKKRWQQNVLEHDIINRYDLQNRFFKTAEFDAGYTDLKKFTLEKRWQPFIPTRLETCSLVAASRNIEYRWPLLDIRLIKYFLAVPAQEHFHRGMGRYLHRRAISGVVPDLVTWKRHKYMGERVKPLNAPAPVKLTPDNLVNDLHPILQEITQVKKIETQVNNLATLPDSFEKQLLRKSLSHVVQINTWLHFFPNLEIED